MAEPFATTADLEAAWRSLSTEETTRAEYLLGKASRQIRNRAPRIDARLDADPPTLDIDLVKDIVCDMVRRTMEAEASAPAGPPIESYQQGVDIFQRSYKYANPTGDMYMTKAEKKDLGIGVQRAATIPMYTVPTVDDDTPWWVT